jgi:hypothetical protein
LKVLLNPLDNKKKTFGYDEISTKLLKTNYAYIVSLLIIYVICPLQKGVSQNAWKYSTVKPLFKKCDRTDVSNYRLISILTCFSKIFEKIIYNRLL